MLATHNDLKELIEFSIENEVASAMATFPMFTSAQIQRLYDISVPQRRHLLHEWGVEDTAMAHVLHHFHSHRNPAQAEKMTQEEADSSNNR